MSLRTRKRSIIDQFDSIIERKLSLGAQFEPKFERRLSAISQSDSNTDPDIVERENVTPTPEHETDWHTVYTLTLVSFLNALHMGSMNFWAYITELDSTITPTFYGYVLAAGSCGHVATTLASGYFSNKVSSSLPCLLTGKITSILGSFLFISIELLSTSLKAVLIFMTGFYGLSMGLMSVMRAQVSSSTSEADRPRAVSFLSLSMTCGIAFGPLLSSILSFIPYPGYNLPFGLHLNLFTIPVYLMACFSIITLGILLSPYFKGQLKEAPVEIGDKNLEDIPIARENTFSYDKLAVGICCFTRVTVGLTMVYLQTINGPYLMATFRWNSEQYVRISSILRVFNGLTGILFSLSFIMGYMQRWISPRLGIVTAVLAQLIFFTATYPWPFLSNMMQYEVLEFNATTNVSTILTPGCKQAMLWCATTPAINIYVYVVAEICCLGVALPMMALNLEILYSTLLGGIKQGTMQGIFIVSGDLLHILGPVFLASMYENNGPGHVWIIMIVTNSIVLVVWLLFYSRMISYSSMLEKRLGRIAAPIVIN